MIEFNLEKHKPKIVYDVQGAKKYLCRVRKMLIHITPEETVRQSFLNYLIKEVKYHKKSIIETKIQEQFLIFSTSIFKKHFAPILREIRKITIISFEKLCIKFIVENGRIENSLRKSIAYKL